MYKIEKGMERKRGGEKESDRNRTEGEKASDRYMTNGERDRRRESERERMRETLLKF